MKTLHQPTLDFYSSATSPNAMAKTNLQDLIEAIQGDEFAAKIAKLRSTLAAGNDDAYSVAKKDLQAVSISGSCTGRRAKAIEEGRFAHSGLLQLDFDAADNAGWEVDEIVEILRAEPRIVAAFVSPSGAGVKGIARIPVCKTKEEHVAAFVAARNHFRQHNLTIDEACKDPVRLMFISHDPNAWIDLDRTAMFEPATSEPELPKAKKADKPGIKLKVGKTAFPEPPREGIHTWLMEAAWWCRFAELSEQDAVARLQAYDGQLRRPYQPTEVIDAVRTVFDAEMPAAGEDWRDSAIVAAARRAPSTAQSFDPDDIFYDGPSSKYLVKVGKSFMTYSKLSPVVTGVSRHLSDQYGDAKELMQAVRESIKNRELDGGVQWHGSIAGHRQGLAKDTNDLPILITSEAKLPFPQQGEAPTITEIIAGAFADPMATTVFMSWLAGRVKAVRAHCHIPSPMLVLAG